MSDQLERLKTVLADRYAIEHELGVGGMATVYLAEDLKHRRKVAIKLLHPELAAVIGAERFLREIEIAAGLTHPHILPLHDSGQADGLLYYVMPYVEGESLRDRLNRETQLSLEDTLQIAHEVADGLSHAHSHGVVHRDIKPENILLSGAHALIADFGIAKAITAAGGARLTETGLSLGTPEYMSPEQASGDQRLDARSDLYALGCVVYEMLAGEPPHTGPTAQAILSKVLSQPVPSLREVRETVPAAVEQVLAKALAKLPADRFATVAQFSEMLKRASSPGAEVSAIAAKDVAPMESSSRAMRVLPWGLTVLMVLILFVALWGPWRAAPTSERQVIRQAVTLPAGDTLDIGYGRQYDRAPDGQRFLLIAEEDRPPVTQIHVVLNWIEEVERRLGER